MSRTQEPFVTAEGVPGSPVDPEPGPSFALGNPMEPAKPDTQPQGPSSAPATRLRSVHRLLRIGLPVVAILVLILWMLGIFHGGVIQGGKQSIPRQSAAGLRTYKVVSRSVPATSEAPGTVQAEQITTVTARVLANITAMQASAGQRVVKGEPLVILDDRDLRDRYEQAQEAVRGAEATLEQARLDYNRDRPLFEQQVIAPYDFEHTETNLKTAEANLRRLQQAQREAEANLSYAAITSPFDGVVIDKHADVGDLASPGKPLLTMYEQDRLWLEASVPEQLMGRVRPGGFLIVRIDAAPGEIRGRVVQTVPASDPSSRTETVRVHLDATRELVPGMFGRLMIPLAPEQVLTIPDSALIRVGQLTMVDAVKEGVVERRTVQLGRVIEGQYEVLSGLASGETVVLRGASPQPSS